MTKHKQKTAEIKKENQQLQHELNKKERWRDKIVHEKQLEIDQLKTEKREHVKRIFSLEKDLGEKKVVIEKQREEIAAARLDAQTNMDFIMVCEKLCNEQREHLREEIADKSRLLQDSRQIISERERENKELKDKATDNLALIKELRRVIKEQETTICLINKPLPSLPKERNKFQKKIGTKITKMRIKTQQLAEKVKQRSQELFTWIEVRAK